MSLAAGDNLKAYAKTYSWKDLGYDMEGETEALVFDSTVKQDQNKFMFDQYKKKNVDNHSVGMGYVKLKLCINDEDYPEEKANWDEYIDKAVNKDEYPHSYFWAVTEAKAFEGSAVVMGSNPLTPTISSKGEPKEIEKKNDDADAIKEWLGLD